MSETDSSYLKDMLSGRIMSEADTQRVLEALRKAGATKPCPRCGNEDFSLLDGYFTHSIQRDLKKLSIGGAKAVPVVVVICTRCGWVAEHALGSLGLLAAGD